MDSKLSMRTFVIAHLCGKNSLLDFHTNSIYNFYSNMEGAENYESSAAVSPLLYQR